jgi:putative mRNA 3-end processing factor
MKDLLTFTDQGIYCETGDFFIDPWKPVDKAIITHAHSDHAKWGHKKYLSHHLNRNILKLRLGADINLQTVDYTETITLNGVKVSFHPAGHIWGSCQIRVTYKGEVWVVSGDYKIENDGFSHSFEPVKCHTFITESTFGLPVFNWRPQDKVIDDIKAWWRANAEEGKASILTAYALGKAQRLIHNLGNDLGPIYVHGSIENVNTALQKDGARLPKTTYVSDKISKSSFPGSLIITPGSSLGTSWVNRFYPYEIATVSGWMQIRGIKRRRNAGHGFVMSDHADWDGLNQAISQTGAERIFVTHGYTDVFSRWLSDQGYDAKIVETLYEGESPEDSGTSGTKS